MKTAGLRINRLIAAALAGLAWGVFSPLPAAADDGDWLSVGLPDTGDSVTEPVWDEAQNQSGSGPAVSLKEVRRIVRTYRYPMFSVMIPNSLPGKGRVLN